ncbi:MAG: lysophospholipid acyltransferase family protein [Roseiarcus sp.]
MSDARAGHPARLTRRTAMIALRSLAFNLAFYVNLIVLMILGLPLIFLRGRHGVFFMARLWGSTSVWLLEKICRLRVEYRGLENIPEGGYILAAKHQSFLETFALLKYAPDFAIVFKRELIFMPLFGLYLVRGRQIAIDRARGHSALNQIIAQARGVLRAGRQVFIFPEGTRRPAGAPPRYKFGVAALYAETGAPCLPVALDTGLFWGRRGFARRPGVAVIEYLPPILPGLERDAFAERLQATLETACRRLYAEAIAADPSLAPVLAAGAATIDKANDARREA